MSPLQVGIGAPTLALLQWIWVKVGQVTVSLKQVSALLTLLLAALLAGPLPGIDGGSGRSSSTALVQLDVALGAASLTGKQSVRDAAGEQAKDDSDTGDAATLAAFDDAEPRALGSSISAADTAPTAPASARAYQARAPPTR